MEKFDISKANPDIQTLFIIPILGLFYQNPLLNRGGTEAVISPRNRNLIAQQKIHKTSLPEAS